MSKRIPIPVIDLFAGLVLRSEALLRRVAPGGLGEGFSSYPLDDDPLFRICLSIEKEKWAHATLLLRSFYREFSRGQAPEEYYRYLRGELSQDKRQQAPDAAAVERQDLVLRHSRTHSCDYFAWYLCIWFQSAILGSTLQWHRMTEVEDMKPEPWVSLEEIARHLGVSTDTVHRRIRARKIPAHRVGWLWRFKVSQADDWVQAGKVATRNEH